MKSMGLVLIPSDEEYLVVTRKINIFALYNVNKHSMLRQKREKSGTGIYHVMLRVNGEPFTTINSSLVVYSKERSKTWIPFSH